MLTKRLCIEAHESQLLDASGIIPIAWFAGPLVIGGVVSVCLGTIFGPRFKLVD